MASTFTVVFQGVDKPDSRYTYRIVANGPDQAAAEAYRVAELPLSRLSRGAVNLQPQPISITEHTGRPS